MKRRLGGMSLEELWAIANDKRDPRCDAARERFLTELSRDLANRAWNLGVPPAEREDVVQDVLMSVARKWSCGTGEQVKSPKAFFREALRKAAISRWRKTAKRPQTALPEAFDELLEHPIDAIRRCEDLDGLRRGLARLPRKQAQVFLLKELLGYSYADIALMLNLSALSVRRYAYLARSALYKYLQDEE